MKKSIACLLVGALLAGTAGCKSKADQKKKKAPVAVQVLELQPRDIARVLTYDADVQGELEVKVFAQVAERIISLPVEEGDAVKQGQTLAVLRAESLTEGVRSAVAAVDAARADRDNLKDELQRAEKLMARSVVAKAQVDQLRARVLSAEAQVRRLEAMSSQASTAKGYASIRSPLTGVVGRRYLSSGDLATPAMPILTVVRMERVELMVEVPEQDLHLVRDGMIATLRVARHPDVFQGRVVRISPTIDRQTRTARVKVRADNPGHRLMPGMLARVHLEVERHKGAVVVPYAGLIIESGGAAGLLVHRAFVVEGNRAAERVITVGIIDGSRVEVTAGLKHGETMVTQGQHLLDPGSVVEIVERVDGDGRPLPVKGAAVQPRPEARAGGGR